MWKTRHVAMISWWPFNLSSKGFRESARRGAATGAIRILLVVYRERCGESSLEEIPVAAPDAQPVAEVTRLSVMEPGLRREGRFGWEEDAPTEER